MLARLAAFGRLTRPTFLAGGIVGGALGTAIAADRGFAVSWVRYAAAQAAITAFHLMTHYANDYFDRAGDAGARRTPFSGGSGVLVEGALAPRVALVAAAACALLGLAAATWLAALGRPASAALAVAIGTLAWAYSAPPIRLLARGLGELDTALVVAVLVPLCAYAAQAGGVGGPALAATLPGAAAMFAMMLAVEFPDRAVDRASGKRNLLVRHGPRAAGRAGAAAVALAFAGVAVAVAAGAPPGLALFELLAVPAGVGLAAGLARAARSVDPETLAGRGVAFFFLVSFFAVLAFASGPLR